MSEKQQFTAESMIRQMLADGKREEAAMFAAAMESYAPMAVDIYKAHSDEQFTRRGESPVSKLNFIIASDEMYNSGGKEEYELIFTEKRFREFCADWARHAEWIQEDLASLEIPEVFDGASLDEWIEEKGKIPDIMEFMSAESEVFVSLRYVTVELTLENLKAVRDGKDLSYVLR